MSLFQPYGGKQLSLFQPFGGHISGHFGFFNMHKGVPDWRLFVPQETGSADIKL